jgi:hypothetical protein
MGLVLEIAGQVTDFSCAGTEYTFFTDDPIVHVRLPGANTDV